MPDYFLSDVHLRLDRPDRGDRLARLVDRLGPADRLTVVGDLCDFWFAARQLRGDPNRCSGLRSLARFRDRGGAVVALGGNHDAWLGPFYEQTFGARFVAESLDLDLGGLRAHVAHGHKVGALTSWKAVMESRAFLAGFRRLPGPIADALGSVLESSNRSRQDAFDRRGLEAFRAFAGTFAGRADLVILGHVHKPLDTGDSRPRLVVLGGWHAASSYLVAADGEVTHVVEPA